MDLSLLSLCYVVHRRDVQRRPQLEIWMVRNEPRHQKTRPGISVVVLAKDCTLHNGKVHLGISLTKDSIAACWFHFKQSVASNKEFFIAHTHGKIEKSY